MASPSPRGTLRRARGGRLPRLTNGVQMLSNQEIANNIDGWINDELEEELRLTAFIDVNTRRQIRLATGVGDMETFVGEFNNGFANSSQLSTDTEAKSKSGEQAFGEAWTDRPRLKKISQEYRIAYRPKSSK